MPPPLVTGLLVGGSAYLLLRGAKAKPPEVKPAPREVVPTPTETTGASSRPPDAVVTAPKTGSLSAPTTTTPKATTAVVAPATTCKTCTSTNTSGLPSTQDQKYAIDLAILAGQRIVI